MTNNILPFFDDEDQKNESTQADMIGYGDVGGENDSINDESNGNESDSLLSVFKGLDQLTEAINQYGADHKIVSKRIEKIEQVGVETKVAVNEHDKRLIDLEQNAYIDEYQIRQINDAIDKRVCKLLGINQIKKRNEGKAWDDYKRYYGQFRAEIHRNAKRLGLEAHQYTFTPKKNFKRLMQFITEWVPTDGVPGLKEYIDRPKPNK